MQSDGRFEVLGEAGSVAGTIDTVLACRARVLVLDLNMGGESSLDAIPRLRAEAPETQIVVLTMQENPAFARVALRSGAVGYVLKDAADTELMNAVLLAAEGRTYLNPQLGARLAAQPPESDTRPDNLSARELEMQLIALGHANGKSRPRCFSASAPSNRTGRTFSRRSGDHARRARELRTRPRPAGLTDLAPLGARGQRARMGMRLEVVASSEGRRGADRRSALCGRDERQVAVQELDPFTHAGQPEPGGGRTGYRSRARNHGP